MLRSYEPIQEDQEAYETYEHLVLALMMLL